MRASVFISVLPMSVVNVIRNLPEDWFELFDTEPITTQIPDIAPKEIPRLVLNNSSGELSFSLSINRINYEWKSKDVSVQPPLPEEFFKDATNRLIEFAKFSELQVNRLAVNYNRFHRHINPGLYMAQHFCLPKWWEEQPMNRPEHFELSSHKRYTLYGDLIVNSWVRNKTGRIFATDEPIIIVEQDINTLGEDIENNVFDNDDIKKFIDRTVPELNNIHELYYPTEDE